MVVLKVLHWNYRSRKTGPVACSWLEGKQNDLNLKWSKQKKSIFLIVLNNIWVRGNDFAFVPSQIRSPIPLTLDQNYINTKNQVIKAERRVLKELGFCVHVKHPHKVPLSSCSCCFVLVEWKGITLTCSFIGFVDYRHVPASPRLWEEPNVGPDSLVSK